MNRQHPERCIKCLALVLVAPESSVEGILKLVLIGLQGCDTRLYYTGPKPCQLGLGGCWAGTNSIKEGVLLGGVIADDSVSKGEVQSSLVHLPIHHQAHLHQHTVRQLLPMHTTHDIKEVILGEGGSSEGGGAEEGVAVGEDLSHDTLNARDSKDACAMVGLGVATNVRPAQALREIFNPSSLYERQRGRH